MTTNELIATLKIRISIGLLLGIKKKINCGRTGYYRK